MQSEINPEVTRLKGPAAVGCSLVGIALVMMAVALRVADGVGVVEAVPQSLGDTFALGQLSGMRSILFFTAGLIWISTAIRILQEPDALGLMARSALLIAIASLLGPLWICGALHAAAGCVFLFLARRQMKY